MASFFVACLVTLVVEFLFAISMVFRPFFYSLDLLMLGHERGLVSLGWSCFCQRSSTMHSCRDVWESFARQAECSVETNYMYIL